jgi:hypothetical protein
MRLTDHPVGLLLARVLTETVESFPAEASAADARREFFDAKFALFASLAYEWSREVDDFESAVGELVTLGLLDLQGAERMLKQRGLTAHFAGLAAGIQSGDLSALYQHVLQLDVTWQPDGYRLTPSKTSRDSSGAYYTPRDLAGEVTRHSLDALIERRTGIIGYSRKPPNAIDRAKVVDLLGSLRIADLSSGGGDFLLAALDYAFEYGSVAAVAAENLWAVDVDPISLTIASAEIARRSGGGRPTVIFGNPLLAATHSVEPSEKANLFAVGRFYSSGMAVGTAEHPAEGYDLLLGNPPWEKIRFEDRKTRELLNSAPESSALLHSLAEDYSDVRHRVQRNPLISHAPRGEANTYALFTLLGLGLLSRDGVMALVLKSAIVTSPVNSALFSTLRRTGGLREVHLFDNASRIFAIDSREKFCVALFVAQLPGPLRVSVGNTEVTALDSAPSVTVTNDELWALYPATGTLPNVRNTSDFRDLQVLAARLPRFAQQHPDTSFGRVVHLTSHAKSITRIPNAESLALLEGKFIGAFTVRAATFDGVDEAKRYAPKATARRMSFEERLTSAPVARYFIDRRRWQELSRRFERPYMLCWRSLTSATNARTTIAAIAPFGPAVQSVQFLQLPDDRELTYLLGLFNSMAFDHLVRCMIPGIDLTQSVVRQIPVPGPRALERSIELDGISLSVREHILKRVELLLRHDPDSVAFVDGNGAQPITLSESEHVEVIAELDQLFFSAYELSDAEVARVQLDLNGYSTALNTP